MDLREMLTGMGYQVVAEAGDGHAAIKLARDLQPDLVIMDIRMPDMDGVEAARILTSEKIAPVLFLTAFNQQDLIDGAKEAGVMGYLVKPFREQDLKPAIEIALERYRQFRAIEREVGSLKEALETRRIVERAKGILMQRLGLTEEEAFKRIHFQARNQNKKMREIAESIITAADLI
ncbi:MAG: response regulator, partial [Dehalococcoidia bacterium]|nr:response regulator [Dehalococcoidia bacterium]